VLTATQGQIFLNLGGGDASFYDFILWLVDYHGGVLTYDPVESSYAIADAKDTSGTAVPLMGGEVTSIEIVFPEEVRAAANVLNSYVKSATTTAAGSNDQALGAIRRDVLIRSAVSSDADARATLEGKRIVQREHEVVVRMDVFPTGVVQPNGLVSFADTS